MKFAEGQLQLLVRVSVVWTANCSSTNIVLNYLIKYSIHFITTTLLFSSRMQLMSSLTCSCAMPAKPQVMVLPTIVLRVTFIWMFSAVCLQIVLCTRGISIPWFLTKNPEISAAMLVENLALVSRMDVILVVLIWTFFVSHSHYPSLGRDMIVMQSN